MSATTLAAPTPVADPNLAIRPLLKDAYELYSRLFKRSVGLAFCVFGIVELIRIAAVHTPSPLTGALVGIVLSFAGTALVQGALAESVRDLHLGRPQPSIGDSYHRASQRLPALLGVSLLEALGIGLGFLLLLVPGFILIARWTLAVPIVMYEGASPVAALGRSNQLVRGHTGAVLRVIVNVVLRVGIASFGVALVAGRLFGGSALVLWLAATASAALTAPYAAHTMSILYYRLVEPFAPIVAEAQQWESVWTEESAEATAPAAEEPLSVEDEYQRRFDEREKRFGG